MKELSISPDDPRYLRELGVEADIDLKDEVVKRISCRWHIPKFEPEKAVLILLGGFQGSGKTTVTDVLSEHISFITVSPDEIRHELFNHIEFSEPVFPHTVHAARNDLVKKAFKTKRHVVLDENATPARLALNHALAAESGYRVVSLYLQTPEPVLLERVGLRTGIPDRYQGTVEELKASVLDQKGTMDPDDFDIIVDTTRNNPSEIAAVLAQKIENSK